MKCRERMINNYERLNSEGVEHEYWATRLRLDGFDNSESIFAAPSVGKYRFSVVFENWSVQT